MAQVTATWASWDRFCSFHTRNALAKLGFVELLKPPSPATAQLPLIASPTPLVTSVLGYLLVVGLGILIHHGKPSTKKKKSDGAVLRTVVQLHNLVLIVLSAYMCFSAVNEAIKNHLNFWGNPYVVSQRGLAYVIYIFFLSKLYEFLDTVIMLVKGNIKQVSVLHVYHHASISSIWWVIAYVAPGGDGMHSAALKTRKPKESERADAAYYSVALNSLVHVVMYTYYFMASVIGKDETTKKKWLWWGRYLTMFQMFQFVTMLLQAAYCWLIHPVYNLFISKLLFFYMITLLLLFGNFYTQKYRAGSMTAKKKAL